MNEKPTKMPGRLLLHVGVCLFIIGGTVQLARLLFSDLYGPVVWLSPFVIWGVAFILYRESRSPRQDQSI